MKPSLALAAAWLAVLAVPGLALQKGKQKDGPPPPWVQGRQKKPKRDGPLITDLPEGYVRLERVPEGGALPRVACSGAEVALVFWKGDASRGDLFLARSSDEGVSFAPGARLNAVEGAMPSDGLLQSASVALGPDGRACAAWIQPGETPSLWFARELAEGGLGPAMELGAPAGLCSNTALAVDRSGTIFLFFAAGELSEGDLGSGRRIFLQRSTDGASFEEAKAVDRGLDGVSELSSGAAMYDEAGAGIVFLYREAHAKSPEGGTDFRGMRLMFSDDGGQAFKSTYVDGWRQPRDPRSTAAVIGAGSSRFALWNARGSVFWSAIGLRNKVQAPHEIKDEDGQFDYEGLAGAVGKTDMLMTWIEQPVDDSASPRLAWRLWLVDNKKVVGRGTAPEVPGPGPAAVFARPSGGFTVLY